MSFKTLSGAFAAAALLAACAQEPPPPPPRPPAPAPVAAPALPTGDGRVAAIRFDAGTSNLTPMARASLGPVLDRLMANPRSPVTITSYSERMDLAMSRARTATVRSALAQHGVAGSRIRVVNAGMMANADPDVVQVQVR
ncbi:CpaD family pilus assembly lipoprotein [Sediminicoccus sp. KRV36]|uniref:CpaD family pilus assembly lipoprotein n=1 Tax=Sediminicoccus sp. KRV36 TaxID=3133721 RepID=UPI00200D83AC|nr:CpaD family pilus assembly lipoprotein [Sediminicoccus rosea]UPY35645.1 CpaD family pilus assembly lipoprotein [Sediminicoccus rosea]